MNRRAGTTKHVKEQLENMLDGDVDDDYLEDDYNDCTFARLFRIMGHH